MKNLFSVPEAAEELDVDDRNLRGLLAEGREVVVCGDVNTAHREIDLARPKANETTSGFLPEERAWMDEFIAHDMVNTTLLDHAPQRRGVRRQCFGDLDHGEFLSECFDCASPSQRASPNLV